jgi:hypothetical protein
LQILESCAKSLQTHAAIVQAVAETLRGDVDEFDENGQERMNKFALLVGQIKDAAAGIEQLKDTNVSFPIPVSSFSCCVTSIMVHQSFRPLVMIWVMWILLYLSAARNSRHLH